MLALGNGILDPMYLGHLYISQSTILDVKV